MTYGQNGILGPHQNVLIICFLSHCQHFLQTSFKSIHNFGVISLTSKQNRQTDNAGKTISSSGEVYKNHVFNWNVLVFINALEIVINNRWKFTRESPIMFKPPHFASTPELNQSAVMVWPTLHSNVWEELKIKITSKEWLQVEAKGKKKGGGTGQHRNPTTAFYWLTNGWACPLC